VAGKTSLLAIAQGGIVILQDGHSTVATTVHIGVDATVAGCLILESNDAETSGTFKLMDFIGSRFQVNPNLSDGFRTGMSANSHVNQF
jgi:hypothetical protein